MRNVKQSAWDVSILNESARLMQRKRAVAMKKSLLLTLIKTSRIGTGISGHAQHRQHRVSTLQHRPPRFRRSGPARTP